MHLLVHHLLPARAVEVVRPPRVVAPHVGGTRLTAGGCSSPHGQLHDRRHHDGCWGRGQIIRLERGGGDSPKRERHLWGSGSQGGLAGRTLPALETALLRGFLYLVRGLTALLRGRKHWTASCSA